MDELPSDIFVVILQHSSTIFKDFYNLSLTSKKINNILKECLSNGNIISDKFNYVQIDKICDKTFQLSKKHTVRMQMI